VIGQTRADYMRKLDELRDEVHGGARRQAEEIAYHHPNPAQGALLTLVNTGRMWERSPQDRNFGHVRIGVGVSRLRTKIDPPANVPPPEYRETVTAVAARDFMLSQNVIHDVARPLHLFDQMGWSFFAEPEQRPVVQAMLRAMVCQLCVWHGPDVVQVAIITDDGPSWEWAKWLPHVRDRTLVDASGPARLIFGDVSDFMASFAGNLLARPAWSPRMDGGATPQDWLVVVVDLPGANTAPIVGPSGHLGVSVLDATGDEMSPLATSATAFVLDDTGNLLRAQKEVT
jgi:DNA segregation ATPase FtsK/SpoIIIE-like protein